MAGEVFEPVVIQFPNMTTTERDLMTAVEEGTIIFNTTTDHVEYWNATAWKQVRWSDE